MSMNPRKEPAKRIVTAVHGRRQNIPDPVFSADFANHLSERFTPSELQQHYARFVAGDHEFDALMRSVFWRALAKSCGDGLRVGPGVVFKHIETFELGDQVFVGAQANIQGRFDGRCRIGDRVWLGPQSYFDARDLVIEDDVGWGPGAKVLGSAHTGLPISQPIIRTDLEITAVRIEAKADVGVGAVILPGVTVGRGSIIGAGAVVTEDVAPYAVVAGVPARFLHWREGYEPNEASKP